MFSRFSAFLGKRIIHYLTRVSGNYEPFSSVKPAVFKKCLMPGDVILIDGNARISGIVRYLTQSTWSHAALYVGDALGPSDAGEPNTLIEALAEHGVVASPLSKYAKFNKRICRPALLTEEDRQKVISYTIDRLGEQYDVRHVVDLARYLMPYLPVPASVRRRLLAFGSSAPTRAICSTLLGNAFHSVRYPILPEILPAATENADATYEVSEQIYGEILHIRRVGLFTPRDFDISPYFEIVKPIIAAGLDYRNVHWADAEPPNRG